MHVNQAICECLSLQHRKPFHENQQITADQNILSLYCNVTLPKLIVDVTNV